jgi:hypothetical protein
MFLDLEAHVDDEVNPSSDEYEDGDGEFYVFLSLIAVDLIYIFQMILLTMKTKVH